MTILFTVLIGASILFSVVPGIPGPFIMFALTLIYSYFDSFAHVTYANLAILFLIAFLSFMVDLLSGILGAKVGGANGMSLVWGWVGLLLGTFIIPIPFVGSLVGFFLGILISEAFLMKKDKDASFKAAIGGLIGALAGTFGNVFMAIIYFALFLFFVIK